jgi:hypothetical protein
LLKRHPQVGEDITKYKPETADFRKVPEYICFPNNSENIPRFLLEIFLFLPTEYVCMQLQLRF